jgi:hypothetical protein
VNENGFAPQAAIFAIRSQDSAQRRHASAHCSIISSSRPSRRQSSSHARQTSAQTAHVRACCCEPRSMKFALVWQISAQSRSSVMCGCPACSPPICRQCCTVWRQIEWQCRHSSMHCCISALVIWWVVCAMVQVLGNGLACPQRRRRESGASPRRSDGCTFRAGGFTQRKKPTPVTGLLCPLGPPRIRARAHWWRQAGRSGALFRRPTSPVLT